MIVQSFFGPSNTLVFPNADTEITRNLILEQTAPGTGKGPVYLRDRPCLTPFATWTTGGACRGTFAQNGRAFAVFGDQFGEVTFSGIVTLYGSVGDDGEPVYMVSNGTGGNQILILSDGLAYIFDTATNTGPTLVADPDILPELSQCVFLDGYFFVNQRDTSLFQFSALFDGTSWDALDIGQRSRASDNIEGMERMHTEIWLMGSHTSEPWLDIGDADFPFAPASGALVERGLLAKASLKRYDNGLMWLGQGEDGQALVYRAHDYTPQRISTHAIEEYLRTSTDLANAVGSVWQQDGHTFYALSVSDLDSTPVYDAATNTWVYFATWNTDTADWEPYRGLFAMNMFGFALLGDREATGALYKSTFASHVDQLLVP